MLLVTCSFPDSHTSTWSSRLSLTRCTIFSLIRFLFVDVFISYLPLTGLVKTHFYGIWVQKKVLQPNHELNLFHKLLADISTLLCSPTMSAELDKQFIVPSSCGKLPTDIGEPSGGSLTADQWLLLATVYGPIVVRNSSRFYSFVSHPELLDTTTLVIFQTHT